MKEVQNTSRRRHVPELRRQQKDGTKFGKRVMQAVLLTLSQIRPVKYTVFKGSLV
jgi:hypothetical protein